MKNIPESDRLDRRILWHLDQNARASSSEIARKVRRGSDTVRYRVRRCFQSGVVRNAIPVVNLHTLGLTAYKNYVKVRARPKRLSQLVKVLDQHPNTYWLAEWYGRWDLLYTFAARSPVEFSGLHHEVLYRFSDVIEESQLAITTCVTRYPKNYLVDRVSRSTQQGDVQEIYKPDRLDIELLKLLSDDARRSVVEISDALESTPTVVSYRIQKLEEAGVILSYRLQFEYQRAGIMLFKIFLQPQRYDRQTWERLVAFSARDHRVTCLVEQLGNAPYELEVELESYDEFHQFDDELRKELDDSIRSMEYAVLRRDHFHRMPEIS